jgi:hypothetical protein
MRRASNKRPTTDNSNVSNKRPNIDVWDTNFEVTYQIRTIGINQGSVYKKTKKLITEAMNKICREEEENNRALQLSDPDYKPAPPFRPKVRFNDSNQSIDIGGDYSGFYRMVDEHTNDATFDDYFPEPTERGIRGMDPVSTRTAVGKPLKVFSTDTQFTLFSQKDGTTPLAYKPGHLLLQEGVKKFQEQAGNHSKNKAKIDLPKEVTIDNLMDHLSKEGHKRLSFGEQHNLPGFRQWLIKNMSHFSGGYIVLEGFYYQYHYKLFQEWQKQPKGTPLPYELKQRAQFAHNMESVLIAANENGVTIIPGDDENIALGDDISSSERTEFMNYQFAHIIHEHVPTNKPLAIVSGLLHSMDLFHQDASTPGVGRGVPDALSIAMLPLGAHPESVMTNKGFSIRRNTKFYGDILVNTQENPTSIIYSLVNVDELNSTHGAKPSHTALTDEEKEKTPQKESREKTGDELQNLNSSLRKTSEYKAYVEQLFENFSTGKKPEELMDDMVETLNNSERSKGKKLEDTQKLKYAVDTFKTKDSNQKKFQEDLHKTLETIIKDEKAIHQEAPKMRHA